MQQTSTNTSPNIGTLLYRLRLREGWLSVVFLALALLAFAWSIEAASWADAGLLAGASRIGIVGMFAGLLLAKARIPRRVSRTDPTSGRSVTRVAAGHYLFTPVAHLLGIIAGALVSVQVSLPQVVRDPGDGIAPEAVGSWGGQVSVLISRIANAVERAVGGTYPYDPAVSLFIISLLVWLLGYTMAWLVFRVHTAWPAISLAGIALFINLAYSPPNAVPVFLVYLASSLLLLVRFNLYRQSERWRAERLYVPRSVGQMSLLGGAALVLLVVGVAFAMPSSSTNQYVESLLNRIGGPWQTLQRGWNNAFNGGDGREGRSNDPYTSLGRSFTVGGPLSLPDTPMLRVKGSSASYLRGVTYDQYDGHGWIDTVEDAPVKNDLKFPLLSLSAGQGLPTSSDKYRQPTGATVTVLQQSSNLLFGPGEAISADLDLLLAFHWEPVVINANIEDFKVRNVDDGSKGGRSVLFDSSTNPARPVPPEVMPLIDLLRANPLPANYDIAEVQAIYANSPEGKAVLDKVESLKKSNLSVKLSAIDGKTHVAVSGYAPNYEDLTAAYARQNVNAGDTYNISTRRSKADSQSLQKATGRYPSWVIGRYLTLPTGFPARVHDLAVKITANYATPYEKTVALEKYLKANYKYDTGVARPPDDADVVDYFLFESKEGYCEYYASAMTTMLRGIGIPARVVTGYIGGEAENGGTYMIRANALHAWTEAYFPGYGWVEFDSTPDGRGQMNRATNPKDIPPDPTPTPNAFAAPVPAPPSGTVTPGGSPTAGSTPNGSVTAGSGAGARPKPVDGGGENNGGSATGVATPQQPASPIGALVIGLLLVVCVGGLLFVAGRTFWRRTDMAARRITSPVVVYGDYLRWTRWAGLAPRPGQTPHEHALALSEILPGAAMPPLRAIVAAYVRARYSRDPDELVKVAPLRPSTPISDDPPQSALAATTALQARPTFEADGAADDEPVVQPLTREWPGTLGEAWGTVRLALIRHAIRTRLDRVKRRRPSDPTMFVDFDPNKKR